MLVRQGSVEPALRVLHITASSSIGGGPEHVWQLTRHLPPRIMPFIAAPNCEPYGTRFVETVGEDCLFTLPQRKISFIVFGRLLRFIRLHHIDIIHSHGKGAGIYGRPAALVTGAVSFHTFHGIHLPSHPLERRAYQVLERGFCRISRACIAVSKSEALQAEKLMHGIDRIVMIPNGVEVPIETPCRELSRPFTLVHATRFDPIKNSLWLLDLALALRECGRLAECQFVLVGDGEERIELERRVLREGFQNVFHFVGTQPSLRPFLSNAGCLISTSHREGLPLAVLEAQSEGIPAVVTDVAGNRDAVVHGVTGFVYPLGDAVTAAKYIGRLLDDGQMWRNMGKAAHRRAAELFSVERMAEQTVRLYDSLLQSRAGGPIRS